MLNINRSSIDGNKNVFIMEVSTDYKLLKISIPEIQVVETFTADSSGNVIISISLIHFGKKIEVISDVDNVVFTMELPKFHPVDNTGTVGINGETFDTVEMIDTLEGEIVSIANPYSNKEYDRGITDGLILGQML